MLKLLNCPSWKITLLSFTGAMGEDKSSLFSLQIWHQSLARNLEPERLKGFEKKEGRQVDPILRVVVTLSRSSEALRISWNTQPSNWQIGAKGQGSLGVHETCPVVSCFMGAARDWSHAWSWVISVSYSFNPMERAMRQFGKLPFCEGLIPDCFGSGRAAYPKNAEGTQDRNLTWILKNDGFWKGTLTYNLIETSEG